MIWRWLIFSSGLLSTFCAPRAAWIATAGTLSGRVELRDSHDASVLKALDYSGIVIFAEPLDNRIAATTPASAPASAPSKHAQMLQKNKTFTPHVLPVQTGTIIDFPNFDPIFHNAFSSYSGQIFDVGLYPPGGNRSVRFARAGVVRVFCNIHPAMSAVILVLNTPFWAKSGRSGAFQMDLPPGSYELHVFHERAAEQTLRDLSRRIQVGVNATELPVITVSEAGYLPSSHKNKYGKDYPPAADDQMFYPGARK